MTTGYCLGKWVSFSLHQNMHLFLKSPVARGNWIHPKGRAFYKRHRVVHFEFCITWVLYDVSLSLAEEGSLEFASTAWVDERKVDAATVTWVAALSSTYSNKHDIQFAANSAFCSICQKSRHPVTSVLPLSSLSSISLLHTIALSLYSQLSLRFHLSRVGRCLFCASFWEGIESRHTLCPEVTHLPFASYWSCFCIWQILLEKDKPCCGGVGRRGENRTGLNPGDAFEP